MRMLTKLLSLAAVCGVSATIGLRADDTPRTPAQTGRTPAQTGQADAQKLVGLYQIVSGKEGTKPIPAEQLEGSLIRFTKDRIVGTDKDRKEIFIAAYTLDTSKTPWVIDMKSKAPREAEAKGLIEMSNDGKMVKIIYNLPGGKEPDDFEPEENQQLFVLKRTESDIGNRQDRDR